MQVKFLQDVHSGLGSFNAGEAHSIEDDYVRTNWIENGLCEPVKAKRAAKSAGDTDES
jgi:hypothetical protein